MTRQATRPISLWLLYPLFFTLLYASHYTLLRLPYFWDEGGYYIPAALDYFRTGTLIPHSTVTNAHPPIPSILLSAAWHVTGFVISGTRTFICLIAAAAMLAVYRLARTFLGELPATAVTILTAAYPIVYVQSTLAHADIFAAAFTLWALALYLETTPASPRKLITIAVLFSLAALSKETAIVTPFALALQRLYLLLRDKPNRRNHLLVLASLSFCVLPLITWYTFHYHRTGFVFGNPEYLRYNATANMDAHRIALSLYHRALHLLTHMNLWVATLLTAACFLLPRQTTTIPRPTHITILIILITNWIAYSILGGALLTRYLLPMYPLILMLFVAVWRSRTKLWPLVAAITFTAFVIALHVNPPYAFAPEDNLTYRDMIVLHQQAIDIIAARYPQATVLTAWPVNAELIHPELGYLTTPIKIGMSLQNFAASELEKAAQQPGDYDTALLFSTKYEPPAGRTNLSEHSHNSDAKYFDFHRDLSPQEAARLLHGEVIWQREHNGEWAAVLRFNRTFNANLLKPEPLPARAAKRETLR